MLKPENNLRWLGIDMRSRWRRRVTVVVTYLVSIGVAGWLSSWHGSGWITPVKALFGLLFAIEFLTIFREGGLVKSFKEPPRPFTVRTGGKVGLRWGRFLVRSSARFRFTTPEKQQGMLRRLDESFPYTIQPDESPNAPDEREKSVADIASRRTLQFLSVILGYNAVSAGMQAKSWTASEVVAMMLSYLVIARTGPQARVLWSEPDPRDAAGEIELVANSTST
jgi:hypothetical protein